MWDYALTLSLGGFLIGLVLWFGAHLAMGIVIAVKRLIG